MSIRSIYSERDGDVRARMDQLRNTGKKILAVVKAKSNTGDQDKALPGPLRVLVRVPGSKQC